MKRYITLLIGLTVLLAILSASASFATFPKPDGSATFQMNMGWYNDNQAWFICTDTNSIRYATTKNLTLSGQLTSALEGTPAKQAARPLYIIIGGCNEGQPVFSAAPPCDPQYSGLWQIVYVKFKPCMKPYIVTNDYPLSYHNCNGLPPYWMADYCYTCIVVDYPIVATGQLGSLGAHGNGRYTIPQAISINTYTKKITLPTFKVYCQNPLNKAISVGNVIIPDASTKSAACLLKANYAPQLCRMPYDDKVSFYAFNWEQYANNGGILPIPPSQYLVSSACPTSCNVKNFNYDYSAVADVDVMNRIGLPIGTVINNYTQFDQYKDSCLVRKACDFVVNAPFVCY